MMTLIQLRKDTFVSKYHKVSACVLVFALRIIVDIFFTYLLTSSCYLTHLHQTHHHFHRTQACSSFLALCGSVQIQHATSQSKEDAIG